MRISDWSSDVCSSDLCYGLTKRRRQNRRTEKESRSTMTETVSLPEGFEALEPYAKVWGKLEDQAQRYLQRQHSSMQELKAYYDAVAPRLNEIFDHLDKFPLNDLPEQEALLYRH